MDLLVDLSAGSETSNCPPLRGRVDQRYGLLDLSPADQAKTDYDSALVLKQLALYQLLAEESRVGGVTREGSGHEGAWNGEGHSVAFLIESPKTLHGMHKNMMPPRTGPGLNLPNSWKNMA